MNKFTHYKSIFKLQSYAPFVLILLLSACQMGKKEESKPSSDSLSISTQEEAVAPVKSRTAQSLDSLGLVDIADLDKTILIELVYATPDNFTGQVLYADLKEAYLHPDAAKAVIRAQQLLEQKRPGYRLVIYDAARPIHIQFLMWKLVKGTPQNIYVANPEKGGGMHNYGVAVDVSIVDPQGKVLDMGTPFDYFDIEAHITREKELVAEGKMSEEALQNRLLLRGVMQQAGFGTMYNEWWHFNLCNLEQAKKQYKLIP